MIMEPPKNETKQNTDSESAPRRLSKRISSVTASAALKAQIINDESSPEVEKVRTRRSTAKPMR